MNYADHYQRLISRARVRVLSGYYERHHIVPRCLGGPDDEANLVNLTPEEHYVAHQLLVKIHPTVPGLVFAAINMARRAKANKAYGWLRRKHASAMLGNKSRTGMKNSENQNNRMAELMRGNKHSLGKKHPPRSDQTRAKLRQAAKGRVVSVQTRAKMSAAHRGRKKAPEHAAKLTAGLRAYWESRTRTCGPS